MSSQEAGTRFDDDALIELAEVLALGEPVPEQLQSLWEAVGHDPEALARLEEHRTWWALAREAALAGPEEPTAWLVLLVRPAAKPSVKILGMEGWIRPILRMDTAGGTHPELVADGRLRLRDVALSIGLQGEKLVVKLRGNAERTTGVRIEATTREGNLLTRTRTDERGTGRLSIPWSQAPEVRLALLWTGRPAEPPAEIDEI